jgi:ABC-type antimicrobial peptide transport system permease subunit
MLRVAPALFVPLLILLVAVVAILPMTRIPFRYTFRNLSVRWRTTAVTALAFTLVIALLTVMMAFVNGMYALTDSTGRTDNVVVLSDGVTDESFSNLAFADASDLESQQGVASSAGTPLCSRETYLVVNQPVPHAPPGRPKRRFLQLRGVEDPQISAAVHAITLHPGGSWFSQAGVRERASAAGGLPAVEAVLGEGIARELAGDRLSDNATPGKDPSRLDVGDMFSLGDRPWRVVGVMQSSGSTFDSEVWAKRSILGPLYGKENYTSLVLRSESASQAESLSNFLNTQYRKAAVQAMPERAYYASLSQTNRQFLVAVVFVAVVMAIGGVFGVMNTMFAAISQRTKDIGVLRLLGYARWQILASFLFESMLIALFGGLLGCGLGALADGWTATSIVGSGHGGGSKFVVLKLVVDTNTIALGIVLSAVTGAVGGLLPAISAVRLRALEALR